MKSRISFLSSRFGTAFSASGNGSFVSGSPQLLRSLPDESMKLIITSPPYNLGKEYETKKTLDIYLDEQRETIKEAVRLLHKQGSICWQIGNYVEDGEIYPLDILLYPVFKAAGLQMRNRIIWSFGHGLHCQKRFSGRYETILWFTKSDDYTFNLHELEDILCIFKDELKTAAGMPMAEDIVKRSWCS
jgi:DNA modification methylase